VSERCSRPNPGDAGQRDSPGQTDWSAPGCADSYRLRAGAAQLSRWQVRSVGTVALNAGSQAATTSRSIRGAYVPVRAAEFIFARW
jgi:hypothetical protein